MIAKLTSVTFSPSGVIGARFLTRAADQEFVKVRPIAVTGLPAEAQSIIESALVWLGGQLGAGYEWSDIALRKIPGGIPATYTEDEEPEQISPAGDDIAAAIYGEHPDLGQSVIPQGTLELPAEIRIGLLAVWDSVESAANAD